MRLILDRANKNSVPVDDPIYFPDPFKQEVARTSPASLEGNPFLGKKVLVMSGEKDPLVPWTASEDFVKELDVGNDGLKEVLLQSGIEHECTPEMVKRMAKFLDDNVL